MFAYALGVVLAVVISWSLNHAILWASLHGALSWRYVIYLLRSFSSLTWLSGIDASGWPIGRSLEWAFTHSSCRFRIGDVKNAHNDNQKAKAAAAASAGAAIGAIAPSVIGGMGLTVGGSPLAIAGGIVGLAGYGLYRACKRT